MPWSDEEEDSSSDSGESSTLETDTESNEGSGKKKAKTSNITGHPSKQKASEVSSGKRKSGAIDFETLKQHGYKGGLSVLKVPPPKVEVDQDWSWSNGKTNSKEIEETYEERQNTRRTLAEAEQMANVQTRREKNASFSQKEKRKRELGQASRGKNYVEEEKRLLRESGVYSGFDA